MTIAQVASPSYAREAVISKDDLRWQKLREIVEQKSLMRGDFILSSGRRSNFLFQLRQTTMFPEGQCLIGSIICEFMQKEKLSCVGGLELGAVPVVCAASFASYTLGHPVDAFFVRKQAKAHGARELIDGSLPDGAEILMVDDVTTSGGSIITAISNAKKEKSCSVTWALSIVDREQGAAETLGREGIRLASIFTKRDFGL